MSNNIRNKTILKAAGIAVFTALFCTGCYDLGLEPSVKPPKIETFVDIRDGKEYKKVQIGDQIWMAENLNYAAEGSVCYGEGNSSGQDRFYVPEFVNNAWAARYLTPSEICDIYGGRLYDWNTAMNNESGSSADPSGVEGVCPVGWHLPSNAEWEKLINYVGEHAWTKLQSHDFLRSGYKPEGTDLYNFSALPAGYGHGARTDQILYTGLGNINSAGYWWTSTEKETDDKEAWVLSEAMAVRWRSWDKHTYFLSVRCVHD